MTSTPIKYNETQLWYITVTWVGVVLHGGANPGSWQGHLKVTARSNQPKFSKIAYSGSFLLVVVLPLGHSKVISSS